MKKNEIYVQDFVKFVKVYEQDLRDEQDVDDVASSVMDCLEGRVSDSLLDTLNASLLGFSGDMQLEIADDLLDFACSKVVHTTGCISADAVLFSAYKWIAEEQGFELVIN